MNSELPEEKKNDITNYQISQSKLLKVTEKLQIFLHNLRFNQCNPKKCHIFVTKTIIFVNSHKLCDGKSHPLLSLKEIQWELRKTDDQNFSMEGETL